MSNSWEDQSVLSKRKQELEKALSIGNSDCLFALAATALQASSIKHALIAGGSAGNLTVSGITPLNTKIMILHFVYTAAVSTDITDLTSEFTITAANTINNTSGTDTTGNKLLVIWA